MRMQPPPENRTSRAPPARVVSDSMPEAAALKPEKARATLDGAACTCWVSTAAANGDWRRSRSAVWAAWLKFRSSVGCPAWLRPVAGSACALSVALDFDGSAKVGWGGSTRSSAKVGRSVKGWGGARLGVVGALRLVCRSERGGVGVAVGVDDGSTRVSSSTCKRCSGVTGGKMRRFCRSLCSAHHPTVACRASDTTNAHLTALNRRFKRLITGPVNQQITRLAV